MSLVSDIAAPALVFLYGYLSRKDGGKPESASKAPWPSAPAPAKSASAPGYQPGKAPEQQIVTHKPMTEAEKRRYPTMTPAEKAHYGGYAPGAAAWGTDEAALKSSMASGSMASTGAWHPKKHPTSAEVAHAQSLLGAKWRKGVIETHGSVQYRGALHPNASGTGTHKGVEVWTR